MRGGGGRKNFLLFWILLTLVTICGAPCLWGTFILERVASAYAVLSGGGRNANHDHRQSDAGGPSEPGRGVDGDGEVVGGAEAAVGVQLAEPPEDLRRGVFQRRAGGTAHGPEWGVVRQGGGAIIRF